MPPQPSFRHAFTRRLRARPLRLAPLAEGARGPRAAHRLLQLSGPTSTALAFPNPATVANHRVWVTTPLPVSKAGHCRLRGLSVAKATSKPPPLHPHEEVDLPQPVVAQTPPVAHRHPSTPEKESRSGRADRLPPPVLSGPCWGDRIARRVVPRRARPAARAAFHSRSRKLLLGPRPRCLPPRRPVCLHRVAAASAWSTIVRWSDPG